MAPHFLNLDMHVANKILNVLMCRFCTQVISEKKWMQAVVKMLVVVANLAKVLLKVINQCIQKHHQNRTVILVIQMNIIKTIFLEIYQLQWTLRTKIMGISIDSDSRSSFLYYPNSHSGHGVSSPLQRHHPHFLTKPP